VLLRFRTIQDIINENKKAGMHWFSKDTMAFFKCKVYPEIYDGKYFITSEAKRDSDGYMDRRFSVREALEDGNIETIKWYCFNKKTEAAKFLKKEMKAEIRVGHDNSIRWIGENSNCQ
jgi:hypothetical protein